MALVRFGSLIQAASGRVGGLCFSRQGGTPIVRTQPLYRRHDSERCLATRAAMAQAQSLWRDLSEANRLAWANFARQFPASNRLGLSRQRSAFNVFMASTVRGLLGGFFFRPSPDQQTPYLLGRTVSVELWPGGPANVLYAEGSEGDLPHATVKAQRLVSTYNGLPGQIWRTVSRTDISDFAHDFWTNLVAAFGTPARLEWFRFDVTQWLPAWPRTLTSRHLVQIPNVGDELTYNGDFQIGGTPPTGWTVVGTGALTQAILYTYADLASGHWIVAAAQPATEFLTHTTYRFTLVAGQTYTLRLAYNVTSGNISVIYYLVPGLGYANICGPLPTADGAWHTLAVQFTPTWSGTACSLRINNAANIPGNVLFDNISIRKDVY